MSLQVGEMPDLNPGRQVLQSGALPLSTTTSLRDVVAQWLEEFVNPYPNDGN